MGLETSLIDEKTGIAARVGSNRTLVIAHGVLPLDSIRRADLERIKVFSAKLSNPLDSDSTDLTVDGSTTQVDFEVVANDSLRVINGVRLIIHDENFDINSNDSRRFGSATSLNTALTNGVQFCATQSGVITEFFTDPVTVSGEFENYADIGGIVNRVNAVATNVDLFIATINLTIPIPIYPGSTDRIFVRIRDDLTSINFFEVLAFGTQQSE